MAENFQIQKYDKSQKARYIKFDIKFFKFHD